MLMAMIMIDEDQDQDEDDDEDEAQLQFLSKWFIHVVYKLETISSFSGCIFDKFVK